jgi:hypothetical protein
MPLDPSSPRSPVATLVIAVVGLHDPDHVLGFSRRRYLQVFVPCENRAICGIATEVGCNCVS